jgi:diguanylate cyclase (GGDEF)-like protein/PAS domain S-box-containing protein
MSASVSSQVDVPCKAWLSRNRLAAHGWWCYLAANLGMIGVYFTAPSAFMQDALMAWASGSAVLAIAGGLWLHRSRHRLPWAIMALGVFAACAGDTTWAIYENVWGIEAPFPSLADAFYLTSYPVITLAVLLLTRLRTRSSDLSGLIDAAIVSVGLGVLSWVFVMTPLITDPSLTLLERVISIAYPLMDVLLLTMTARLSLAPGPRSWSIGLLLIGIVCWFLGDTFYAVYILNGMYQTGVAIDAFWLVGFTAVGMSALHPSMRDLTTPADARQDVQLRTYRIVLLMGAALLAPTTLLIQYLLSQPINVPVIAGGSVVLFVLVLTRMDQLIQMLATARVRLEHALERERIIRLAAADFVSATTREQIHAITLRAALALNGDTRLCSALLLVDVEHQPAVAGALGWNAGAYQSGTIDLQRVPAPVRTALLNRQTIQVALHATGATIGYDLDLSPRTPNLCCVPLTIQQRLGALLIVARHDALPAEAQAALATLGAKSALALESVLLAEDLFHRQSEERMAALVQNASDVIAIIDTRATVRYVSPSVRPILGYEPEALLNTTVLALVHPDDTSLVEHVITALVQQPGATEQVQLRARHRDGAWLHVETIGHNLLHDPAIRGIVLNTRDVTERKVFEQQLTHQAFHDALTGLPNRALFVDRLHQALARAARHQTTNAVLFLDLDRFKTVNDSLGHEVGDLLLVAATERILGCIRPEDTVARFGGDEFTILLEDVGDSTQAVRVAERILEALQRPLVIAQHEIVVSASIGVVLSTSADSQPSDVLRYADVAMYQAKHAGRARFALYDRSMNNAALENLTLEHDLRRAIERDELRLHYQPIVELATGRIAGMEALVRWQHPQRGMLSPAVFIPLAEETGLILSIGTWVIEEACRTMHQWHQRFTDGPAPAISVNLSARQFRQPNLAHHVAQALQRSGLAPQYLTLEITESVVMEDAATTIVTLHDLKALGIKLAIDDFGTGYSSLSYLKRFPVDTLKIDRSFLAGLGQNPEDTAIVEAVTNLAHALNLSVTAEGVETAEVRQFLCTLGSEQAQGYFFGRPLPADAATQLLATQHVPRYVAASRVRPIIAP